MTDFALESAQVVIKEIGHLLEGHYDEVTHHHDIPLGCDYEKYAKAQELGILRIYTIRSFGVLVGYDIFIVGYSAQSKSSLQAQESAIYLEQQHRKGLTGYKFIKWVDAQLEAEEVQIIHRHISTLNDYGFMLERAGYQFTAKKYEKNLNA